MIIIGIREIPEDWYYHLLKINNDKIILVCFTNIDIQKHINDIFIPLSTIEYNFIKNFNVKYLYPDEKIIELFHNKSKFVDYMLLNFIENIPKTYVLNNKVIDENFDYPLIYKPQYSTNGRNMIIIKNIEDYNNIKEKHIIQKFIEDEYEYSMYLICENGKILNHLTIRNKFNKYFIKTHNFTTYEIVKNLNINVIVQIIKDVNYNGGACVDFKVENNDIKIFEINPRFGGSLFTCDLFEELMKIFL